MPTGIKVKDAMVTKVVTASPTQTVQDAARIMKEEDVGSVIICEGKNPLGIVTREDIVNKVTSENKMASKIFLKEIMSMNLITCTPDDDIADVAKTMSKYRYERLPVVSFDKLIGIISAREIAKVAPAVIEIMTEHLRIEEPQTAPEEDSTEGECELCGNYSDNLHKINDRWVCDRCEEEAKQL
jgi:CBS domain-containing protein